MLRRVSSTNDEAAVVQQTMHWHCGNGIAQGQNVLMKIDLKAKDAGQKNRENEF